MLIAAHVFGPQQRSESLEVGGSDRHRRGGVCSYTAIDIAGSMLFFCFSPLRRMQNLDDSIIVTGPKPGMLHKAFTIQHPNTKL